VEAPNPAPGLVDLSGTAVAHDAAQPPPYHPPAGPRRAVRAPSRLPARPGATSLPPSSDARDGLGSTARLWARRSPGSPAVASAVALVGIDQLILADALSISLAASPEATTLLDGMELRVRTLPTSVETTTERCVNSIRGPVLWSETLTARANALGNDDVFVCATPSRSFDTVENRVLVAALEAIARAARALRGPAGEKVSPHEVTRIAAVAEEARRWRRHPRLSAVPSTRLNGRDMARLRSGHRSSRMVAVVAVRDRVAEPFVAEDLEGLADPWTRRYHNFVSATLDAVIDTFDEPAELSLVQGSLRAGALAFRHPAAGGDGPAGLSYRGIPLLPRDELVRGAPWAHLVPTDGVAIVGPGDLRRLLERLRATAAPRR